MRISRRRQHRLEMRLPKQLGVISKKHRIKRRQHRLIRCLPNQNSSHLENAQLQTKTAPSGVVPPKTAWSHLQKTPHRAQTAPPDAVSPKLLRCVIASWSEQRADFIRKAAETESWETLVCHDSKKLLQSVFRMKFPLMFVDLPGADSDNYDGFRNATVRSCAVSKSLLCDFCF